MKTLTHTPNRVVAIVMAFALVLGMLLTGQLLGASPAHAAPADGPSGGTVDFGGSTGTGGGGTDTHPTDNPVNNPVNNSNISLYKTVECVYGGSGTSADTIEQTSSYDYPLKAGKTCRLGISSYLACLGADICLPDQDLTCPAHGDISAKSGAIMEKRVITTAANGAKKTTITRYRNCFYPDQKIVPTYQPGLYGGICPISVVEDLYYSDSASTINQGSTGTVSVNSTTGYGTVTTGSKGGGAYTYSESVGGGSVVRAPGGQIKVVSYTMKKKYTDYNKYVAACHNGSHTWNFKLPDAENGEGSLLGYYRQQATVVYVPCHSITYAGAIAANPELAGKLPADSAECDTDTRMTRYKHDRYTNTCVGGLESGVNTGDAKYFDISNCAKTFGWTCTAKRTQITDSTAATVRITRNGSYVPVKFTKPTIGGEGIRSLVPNSITRTTNVDQGATPYFPGSDNADYSSNNSNLDKQFFRLYKTNEEGDNDTRMDFGTRYKTSAVGDTNYLQFYWASDANSPWSINTTWTFSAVFKTKESTSKSSGVKTTYLTDSAACPTTSDSTKVNVLRSVNTTD